MLFFLVVASVTAAERQVLHGHVPEAVARLNLQPVGQLPATNHLHLAFILPQRNQDALGKLAQDLYNPSSTNFHRYLTPAQFNERFAPADADYQTVIGFAKAHGLTVAHTVPGRTIVGVDAAVADIEKALHVRLLLYRHPTEPRQFFAPDVEPSLDLEVPIQVIRGLNNYVIPHHNGHMSNKAVSATPMGGSYSDGSYMASDLRHAFVPGTSLTGVGQGVGLYEMNGYAPADIIAYEATNGLPNVPVQYVAVNGVSNILSGTNWETADIEVAIAMAPGLSEVVYYNGDDTQSIFTEMADPTHGESLPLQLSSSWGYDVDTNICSIFTRFAVQGQSYCGESGDGGARNLAITESAAAPYETVVGGTELYMNGNGVSWSNETVWGNAPYGWPTRNGPSVWQRRRIHTRHSHTGLSTAGQRDRRWRVQRLAEFSGCRHAGGQYIWDRYHQRRPAVHGRRWRYKLFLADVGGVHRAGK